MFLQSYCIFDQWRQFHNIFIFFSRWAAANVLEILRQMVSENYIFKKGNQREFKNLCATKSEL